MTATTLDRPEPGSIHSLSRLVIALAIAAVLVAGAFVVGRATSPSHTVQAVVTVPVASGPADVPMSCHLGQAC